MSPCPDLQSSLQSSASAYPHPTGVLSVSLAISHTIIQHSHLSDLNDLSHTHDQVLFANMSQSYISSASSAHHGVFSGCDDLTSNMPSSISSSYQDWVTSVSDWSVSLQSTIDAGQSTCLALVVPIVIATPLCAGDSPAAETGATTTASGSGTAAATNSDSSALASATSSVNAASANEMGGVERFAVGACGAAVAVLVGALAL
jgi:hypothetical protein